MKTFSYNAHDVAVSMVRPGADVLDVGCGPGLFAGRAASLGCRMVGLERSADALDQFVALGLEGHQVDLDDVDALAVLDGRTFDQIVALDVLEHLRDPQVVLQRLVKHLAPQGELIVSIPNVTHLDVRVELWSGSFRYTDDGLLDRTHLRFFDRPALDRLVAEAGLSVLLAVEVARDGAADAAARGVPADVLASLSSQGDADVQQWVLLTAADGHTPEPSPLRMFADDAMMRDVVLHDATAYARELERRTEDLERQLHDALLLEREVESQRMLLAEMARRADALLAERDGLVTTYRALEHEHLALAEAHRTEVAAAEQQRAASAAELAAVRNRLSVRAADRMAATPWLYGPMRRLARLFTR